MYDEEMWGLWGSGRIDGKAGVDGGFVEVCCAFNEVRCALYEDACDSNNESTCDSNNISPNPNQNQDNHLKA